MPGGLKIHLYCLCWNDARMLPYFFRHYDDIVDEYYVYDNGSTDASLEMLHAHGRVHVDHFDVEGDSFVDVERRLSDTIWQPSRGKADWVLVTDIDEHLYRPDMVEYLARCKAQGITAIHSLAYEMVADEFPTARDKLYNLVTQGWRALWALNRLCFFDPNAIVATNFGHGRHEAFPEGNVVWPDTVEVLLLHFKQLGLKYLNTRTAELAQGMKERDLQMGWGSHYQWNEQEIYENWAKMKAQATTVPGLGALSHVPPAEYRGDEAIVERSGLLDGEWYLAEHPDLSSGGVDPLIHFSRLGWRERRQPNFYFDTAWYLTTYPQVDKDKVNPVVHYVRVGERQGLRPGPHFDPAWYREQYHLSADVSPLQHFLQHRRRGLVSPLPDFDVENYCRTHPEVLAQGLDPYEHYFSNLESPAAADGDPADRLPEFNMIASTLGIDPDSTDYPASVPWPSVAATIRLFLRGYPFDEDWYRKTYPDVDEAIREGGIESAFDHFIDHGFFEGRSFRPTSDNPHPPADGHDG